MMKNNKMSLQELLLITGGEYFPSGLSEDGKIDLCKKAAYSVCGLNLPPKQKSFAAHRALKSLIGFGTYSGVQNG